MASTEEGAVALWLLFVGTLFLLYRSWFMVKWPQRRLKDLKYEFRGIPHNELPLLLVDSSFRNRCGRSLILVILNGSYALLTYIAQDSLVLWWGVAGLLFVEAIALFVLTRLNERRYVGDLHLMRRAKRGITPRNVSRIRRKTGRLR